MYCIYQNLDNIYLILLIVFLFISRCSKYKMELFSAHDTTLMGLLLVLNRWDDVWPKYVSLFKLELYKNQVSKPIVIICH